MLDPRFWTLTGMVLAAAFSRLIPHPPNVAPIAAMALFGGAFFPRMSEAFAVTLAALALSDIVIGFHSQVFLVYACFLATVCIGFALKRRLKTFYIGAASLAGSILFFVVTNFGVWLFDGLYPHTFDGLVACYTAAVPFFRNSAFGDLAYTAVLFGSFLLAQRRIPSLGGSMRLDRQPS